MCVVQVPAGARGSGIAAWEGSVVAFMLSLESPETP
jgi:hypothetical protein